MNPRLLLGIAFGVLLLLPAPSDANFRTEGRCTARKITGSSRDASAELTCHERAALRGIPVDPDCIAAADDHFLTAFERAEDVPPCTAIGDAAAIATEIDQLVADLLATIGSTMGDGHCRARKLHVSAARARAEFACYRRAAQFGEHVKATCLSRAQHNFDRAFAGAGNAPGCSIADQGAIDTRLAAFISQLHSALRPRAPTHCTSEKFDGAGDETGDELTCYASSAPPVPSCLSNVDQDVSSKFANAELDLDCAVYGEFDDVAAAIDEFADDAAEALLPSMTLDGCSTIKLREVGRAAERIVGTCLQRAYRYGLPIDETCVAKAHQRLNDEFVDVESAAVCSTTGDAPALSARVDTFADLITTLLTNPNGTAEIPTALTVETVAAGGVCGAITTNLGGSEGVPGRRDPSDALTDPNAACVASGNPKPCCTGSGAGHCDEGTTITCGAVSSGGGGGSVGDLREAVVSAGLRRRYSLACTGISDTACSIGGDPGDLPSGIQCSTTGCGVSVVESTDPLKMCAVSQLGSSSAGVLDLTTGEISLTTAVQTTHHIITETSFPDTGCPRCRASTGTTSPAVFSTGPGAPGVGVCDDDAANVGAPCFVFEPAGSGAGLSTACDPSTPGGGTAALSLTTTATTSGASVSDPAGHFCGAVGQGGNSDCLSAGMPQACCSGAGMGSCPDRNGCFASANASGFKYADTPAVCTGISVAGSAPGPLLTNEPPPIGTFAGLGCVPAAAGTSAILPAITNGANGLPGPIAVTWRAVLDVD